MQEIFTSWQPAAELAPREVLGPVADELRGLIAARAPMLPGCSTARLFGLDLLRGQRDGVASALVEAALRGQRTTVGFINAHCINTLKRDAGYAQALQAADFLLPDGSGMAIAARLAGEELGDNLNGTDLFPLLCAHAAERGASMYLLGGKPGIAAAAAATMRSRYPGLRVAGTHHGYVAPADEPALLADIAASGADLLLVGMGVPRQEQWIARHRWRLAPPVVLGVGGLFDYYSGAVRRAPLAFRAVGMEWAWRLMQEPRRLFARYVLGNPLFLAHAFLHACPPQRLHAKVSRGAKVAFDRVVGALALALLLPLFLAIAAAIRLEDRGPVFFRQTRIGLKGRPFSMWKFRSMVVDAEEQLADLADQSEREGNFKLRRDPRVTRVGAILRRTSLDELPQLFNVLAGEMSLVGPRPALPGEVLAYDPASAERLNGLPGLTCTWQISGRAEISFEDQVRLDVDYLRHRSLWGDIKLILKTIPAVLTARGAY